MLERSRVGAMNYFKGWEGMRRRVAEGFGMLINASLDELAFTMNTHEGLNTVTSMIPWKPDAVSRVSLISFLIHD